MSDVDATIAALRATTTEATDNAWLIRLEHRSPDPTVCPFLCSVEEDGQAAEPLGAPDAVNRCAALREPVPQSLRQQELVCLTSSHVHCPRYLRGAMVAGDTRPGRSFGRPSLPRLAVPRLSMRPPARPRVGFTMPQLPRPSLSRPSITRPAGPSRSIAPSLRVPSVTLPALRLPKVRMPNLRLPSVTRPAIALPKLSGSTTGRATFGRSPLTPAIAVSLLILIAAFSGSVAFVVGRGGISLSAVLDRPSPSPTALAIAPSPAPTPRPTTSPTASPTPSPTPSPTLSPTPSPTPTPTPTADPTARPTPRPTAAGDPILARFPELRRCPNRSDCYIYVVEPGNNLYSIARYYRVSYDRVLAMNPQITNAANIRAGDAIRLPTPNRR